MEMDLATRYTLQRNVASAVKIFQKFNVLQNIKKGMLLFGCISGIHPKKLIIDLPNSLSGAATTDSVRSMYDEVYIKQNKILLQVFIFKMLFVVFLSVIVFETFEVTVAEVLFLTIAC